MTGRQRRRRYRYHVLAMGVMVAAGVATGGLTAGLVWTTTIMLTLVVTLATLAVALLGWWLLQGQLRAQGWEW